MFEFKGRKEVTCYFGKMFFLQDPDRSHPVTNRHFPLPKLISDMLHTTCKDTVPRAGARDDPNLQFILCWHLIHEVSWLAVGVNQHWSKMFRQFAPVLQNIRAQI